jgi:DNA-binding NarL/FixJ family response regulator
MQTSVSQGAPVKEKRGPASLSRLRVVLVEENALLRAGLRAALLAFGITVAGEALDVDEAVALVSQLSPAAVIIGLPAKRGCGIEATRRLSAVAPTTPVMVLADSTEPEDVTAAIMAGARGYMLKDAQQEAIAGAVRAVASGDSVVSSSIASHLLDRIRNGTIENGEGESGSKLRDTLTDREIEVLKLVAAGRKNSEIARALNISPSTVKNHAASILAKLSLDNRVQAAVYAVRCGIA